MIRAALLASCLALACSSSSSAPAHPEPPVDVAALSAQGRDLFFGRGGCVACHKLGDEGTQLRGPNLDVGDDMTEPVAARAAARRPELAALDYLVESMVDPDAVVVAGYAKGVMKHPDQPPISLRDDEIVAVAVFLLDYGGGADELAQRDLAGGRAQAGAARRERARRAAHDWAEQRIARTPWEQADPERGAHLYGELGCPLCHGNPDNPEVKAPNLDGVGARLARNDLARWLIAPPPGRMPSYADSLGPGQLADLCRHLQVSANPGSH